MSLKGLPKTIAHGIAWISFAAVFASWAGWLEPPNLVAARARAQIEQSEKRAADAERAIWVLQYQQQATASELTRMNNKLEEMAMVLYSLERRSR